MEPTVEQKNTVEKAVAALAPHFASKAEVGEATKSAAAAAERSVTVEKNLTAFSTETSAKLAKALESIEGVSRQVAELRAMPGIISQDTRERDKAKKQTSLSRLIAAKWYRAKTGNWPSGKEFGPEVAFLQSVHKALDTATSNAGAELVPEEWSSEIIESLKAGSVVLAAGPRIYTFNNKKLHLSSVTGQATYQWLGEGAASTESTPATGEVVLDLSTARGLSYFSLEFMREAGPGRDASVLQELVEGLLDFVDDAYLEGSGSNRPTGMNAISGINTIGADNDNANGGEINADDLARAVEELDADNVPVARRAWFLHPRKWWKIYRLKDAEGRSLRDELGIGLNPETGRRELLGYPVFTSTQIQTDQSKGSGSNLSHIMLAAMSDIAIGFGDGQQGVEVAVSEEARFANAQIAVRVMARTDIKARHAVSICDITGVA